MDDHPNADITVGSALRELVREPTAVQLFGFSAVTWNSHRIHYDRDYSRNCEGYPDVLVQSHLHACFLVQSLRMNFGFDAEIVKFSWRNRAIAVPGDRLTTSGAVTRVDEALGRLQVDVELKEMNQRGELCVSGQATLRLPRKGH